MLRSIFNAGNAVDRSQLVLSLVGLILSVTVTAQAVATWRQAKRTQTLSNRIQKRQVEAANQDQLQQDVETFISTLVESDPCSDPAHTSYLSSFKYPVERYFDSSSPPKDRETLRRIMDAACNSGAGPSKAKHILSSIDLVKRIGSDRVSLTTTIFVPRGNDVGTSYGRYILQTKDGRSPLRPHPRFAVVRLWELVGSNP